MKARLFLLSLFSFFLLLFNFPLGVGATRQTLGPGDSQEVAEGRASFRLFSNVRTVAGLGHQPAADSKVEWLTENTHDFGDIPQKKPARYDFQFRNISGEPLIIDNVRTSCGCTVADWEAAAVPPDSLGAISIEYDARDLGYFYKKVKVYFHGQRKAEVLYVEGWVE